MKKVGIWMVFVGVALPILFLPLTSLLPPMYPEDTRGLFDRIGALGMRVSPGKGTGVECEAVRNRLITGSSLINPDFFDEMERDQNPGRKTNYEICMAKWESDPRTVMGRILWFTTVLFAGTLIATVGVGLLIAAKLQSP